MPDITERILSFNKGRLPDMLQRKYKTMAGNIFSFYRGTCHLFYEDLSKSDGLPASPATWICGDLHLENFGSYKGDNRLVYFDLNDFDEAVLAPCLWEISRILTSIFIAFEYLGISRKEALAIARKFVTRYALTLAGGKAISIDPRTAKGIVATFLETVEERKQKELLKKRTCSKKGELLLSLDYEKHGQLDKELKKELERHISTRIKTPDLERHGYQVTDCAFRIAGTGSLGVKRYVFLLKSSEKKNKYLLLDMKQAMPSSLAPYVRTEQPAWQNEAIRVVQIQQRMQDVSRALLDTSLFKGDSFVIREMQPTQDTINFELIKDRYNDINQVINDMALLAASSQLRSSGRQGSAITDQLIAFGQSDLWRDSLLHYAEQYASQVKKDYTQYVMAYKAGKLG
jgi:uncharacterized protein (DUF2252 family)